MSLPRGSEYFTHRLLQLGRLIRASVIAARRRDGNLAAVSKVMGADTIYQLDMHVEPVLEAFCEQWSRELPLVLVAEGIEGVEGTREGVAVFPRGSDEAAAQVRIICDPIDGTRGLMYDKRSAWFLAGAALNKGDDTRLGDIFAAVQMELPTAKQSEADVLLAVRDSGAKGLRERIRKNGDFKTLHELVLRPSQADNIDHGFASIANFFPGTKELASRLMETIAEACLGAAAVGQGVVFDDQYISTGGQLYELIMGHDRFTADLRPLFYKIRGRPVGMCVHPYDLSAILIAQEAGVQITDGLGGALDGPLDVQTPLAWAGFANPKLRTRIEPVLIHTLRQWLDQR